MTSATLDRLLAVLLGAIGATGLLSLRAGAPSEGWVFVVHGVLGGLLLVATGLKLRRTIPGALRRADRRRRIVALSVTMIAGASVVIGFLAVASGQLVIVGPWTLISWHAILGIALLPVLLLHLLPRRWRLLRPRLARRRSDAPEARAVTRRSFLTRSGVAMLGVAAAGTGAWATAAVLDRVSGGSRRFTGSRWLPRGGIPPATTFFGEGTAPIDPATWRLRVTGRVGQPREYSLGSLAALGETDRVAVLDCTSGWAIESTWRGVPLAAVLRDVLADPAADSIVVRSVTGWAAALGASDVASSFLATHVAGVPLPTGNGAPCRLVVDGRRGLDWVKWVTEIHVA
jgi:hypothetical protein